ncbi:MAG: ArsR family transcriptional regulator, partial [Saprospiraceae bacterium]|nr:ArsR family transcriptional regulator [Saprospiraceae bacterium]
MTTLEERKQQFIQTWGILGMNWGINKTMAQIHGLLLVSPEPMCQDDIIYTLGISVGNASMNLRALIDWGIVYKTIKNGNRKEYYEAEKDM